MYVRSLKNIELIKQYLEAGYIMCNKHPEYDIWVYTYTKRTVYDQFWNNITLSFRGIVLDSDYNVIARPFGKFFNIEEHASPLLPDVPKLPFVVTEKVDGSLIITFKYKGELITCTKGSFKTNQAKIAHEIISEKTDIFMDGYTYLFEVIYPDNKIIVDYKGKKDVVLLDIIETETNRRLGINYLKTHFDDGEYTVVKKYDGLKIEHLKQLEKKNKEGFVVTFSNGFMVKVKFDEYKRLHAIISNTSTITIWKSLMNGDNIEEMLDGVPDEFYNWVKSVVKEIGKEYKSKYFLLYQKYNEILSKSSERKEFASNVLKTNLNSDERKALFIFFDQKEPKKIIYRLIKPEFKKIEHE